MMDFKQAENRFKELKAQFEAGTLTETEFKIQLEELMLQDERGDWWMIGYETERWYRHDGTNWVQADPPGILNQESSLHKPVKSETTEDVEAEKVLLEKEKEAGDLHYQGMLAQKQGKYDEAERLFRQSLAIAVDLKDEQGKANILQQLAILTKERLDREKKERENAEKAARAKAEREAAEKAAREKARQEAAEKAAREKAERDASFKTTFEETGPKATGRTAREETEPKVAQTPADVTKQNIEKSLANKRFLLSWRGRMLLGGGVGLLFGIMAGGYFEYAIIFMVAGGLAGLITYPHKLSIIFLILGFLVVGFTFGGFFPLVQVIFFILAGALLSRILHWAKVLK